MKAKKTLLKLLGIILFVFILTKIDLNSFFRLLKNINVFYFILAAFMAAPILIIKAYRWNYIKRTQKIDYRLSDSILMYGSGLYIGLLTPGRIGDFIKVIYLKNDGNSTGKSFVSVFVDRLADISFLFLVGYFGMFFFSQYLKQQIIFITLLVAFSFIILFMLFIKRKFFKKLTKKLFNFFIPNKHKEKIKINFNEFYYDLRKIRLKTIGVVFFITIAGWIVYFIQMFLIAKSIGVDISFFTMALFSCIAGLITLIPVSISGIGTRDLMMIFLFSLIGIGKEYAVAVSILILSMNLVMALIGLFCWLKKPIKIKSET
jgi:hypothetical protein